MCENQCVKMFKVHNKDTKMRSMTDVPGSLDIWVMAGLTALMYYINFESMSSLFEYKTSLIITTCNKKLYQKTSLTLDVHIPLVSEFPLDHSTSASLRFRSARWMVLLLSGKLNVKYSSNEKNSQVIMGNI